MSSASTGQSSVSRLSQSNICTTLLPLTRAVEAVGKPKSTFTDYPTSKEPAALF